MSRTLGATTLSHLASDPYIIPVYFVTLEQHDATVVYYHDDVGTIPFGGHDYLGLGVFGSIDPIEETDKIEATQVKLRLSGIDPTTLDQALLRNFYGRTATVAWALRNAVTGQIYNDPAIQFYGRIDQMNTLYTDGEATIEVELISEAQDWSRVSGEMYSDSQLQKDYPGDLLFQYLAKISEVAVHWVKAQTVTFGAGPTGGNGSSLIPRYPPV
jgi:hypothetical protein